MKTNYSNSRAFTLVELLVVLAIFAVLLAILLPMLGKARYQAKLSVCLSNLRQVGQGGMSFAIDHNGSWPTRNIVVNNWVKAVTIKYPIVYYAPFDLRPTIKNYISLNKLACPLSPYTPLPQNINGHPFDYENDTTQNSIEWNYGYYFGWQYAGNGANNRVGQPFAYAGKHYRVLAGDHQEDENSPYANSYPSIGYSHQDSNSSTFSYYNDAYGSQVPGDGAQNSSNFLFSRWQNFPAPLGWGSGYPCPLRGAVDLNFLFDDLSARTIFHVNYMASNRLDIDLVPAFQNPPDDPTWFTYLPHSNN